MSVYRVGTFTENPIDGSSPGDMVITSDPSGRVFIGEGGKPATLTIHGEGAIFNGSIDIEGGNLNSRLNFGGSAGLGSLQVGSADASKFNEDLIVHALDANECTVGIANDVNDPTMEGAGVYISSIIDSDSGRHSSRLYMRDGRDEKSGLVIVNNATGRGIADNGSGVVRPGEYPSTIGRTLCWDMDHFSIDSSPDGNYVVAYVDASNSLVVTRGMNTVVGETTVISASLSVCGGVSVVMLEDTGFVVSWEAGSQVWIKYYNADNITPLNPYLVDSFTGVPKLSLLPDNRFSLTADGGRTRIYELPVSTAFIEDSPINVDMNTYCLYVNGPDNYGYLDNMRPKMNTIHYSAFLRFIVAQGDSLVVVSFSNDVDGEVLSVYVEAGRVRVANSDVNGGIIEGSIDGLDNGAKHSLAVSVSGLQVKVYVDGVLDISGSIVSIPTGDRIDTVKIGAIDAVTGVGWKGYIDDFVLIGGVISNDQVKEVNNGGYSLLDIGKSPLLRGLVVDTSDLRFSGGGYSVVLMGGSGTGVSLVGSEDNDFTPSSAYLKGKSKVVISWTEMQGNGRSRVMYRVCDVSGTGILFGDILFVSEGGAFEELNPHVVGLHDGGFAIAWETAGYEGEARRVLLRMFGEDGSGHTGEIGMGTTPESDQRNPYIVSLCYTGGVVVLWDSIRCGYTTRTAHYQRVDMFGRILDPLEMPVTDDIYNQIRPSGIELPDGKFAVSYISNPDGEWRVDGRRFMVSTGMPFDPGHATISDVTSSVDPSIRPKMVMMTMREVHDGTSVRTFDGLYCVLWKGYNLGEKNTIFMRVNNHIGARVDDDFAINVQTESFHFVHNFEASEGKDGTIGIAWDMRLGTGDTDYVYFGAYDASGSEVVSPFRAVGGSSGDKSIRPSIVHVGGDHDVYSKYGIVYEKDRKSVEIALIGMVHSSIVGTLSRFDDKSITSSLELDGTKKYVRTYDGVLPPADSSISVCAWIKSEELYGVEWRTIVYVGGVTGRVLSMGAKGDEMRVYFGESSEGSLRYEIALPYNIHNGVWHHVCVSCDLLSQRGRLFVDGHMVWERGVPFSQQVFEWSVRQVHMGSVPRGDVEYTSVDASSSFVGKLSNVTVHDVALMEEDVIYMYNGGNPPDLTVAGDEGHPLGLWAWWTLSEFANNTSFRDDSGGDHNAKLYRFEYSLREIVESRWNIRDEDAGLFGSLRAVASGWSQSSEEGVVVVGHDSRMCVVWVDGVVNSVKGVIGDISGSIMGEFEMGGRVGEIKELEVTSLREELGVVVVAGGDGLPRGFTLVWSEERTDVDGVVYYEMWTAMVGFDGVLLGGFEARRVDTVGVGVYGRVGARRLGIGVCDLKSSGFFMTWGSMARAFDVVGVPITYEVDMCELTGAMHNVSVPPIGCIPLARPCVTREGVIVGWVTIDALSGEFYVQVTSLSLNAYSQCNIIEEGQVAFMRKDGNIDRGISTMSIDKPTGDIHIHVKCPESTLRIGGGVEFLGGERVTGLPREPTGFRVFYPRNTDINIFVGAAEDRRLSGLMILEDDVMPGPDPREWRVRDPLNMSEFNVEVSFQSVGTGEYMGVTEDGGSLTSLPWSGSGTGTLVGRATWRAHMIGTYVICFQNSWSLKYISYDVHMGTMQMVERFRDMTLMHISE